jgi:hypothetical protein
MQLCYDGSQSSRKPRRRTWEVPGAVQRRVGVARLDIAICTWRCLMQRSAVAEAVCLRMAELRSSRTDGAHSGLRSCDGSSGWGPDCTSGIRTCRIARDPTNRRFKPSPSSFCIPLIAWLLLAHDAGLIACWRRSSAQHESRIQRNRLRPLGRRHGAVTAAEGHHPVWRLRRGYAAATRGHDADSAPGEWPRLICAMTEPGDWLGVRRIKLGPRAL